MSDLRERLHRLAGDVADLPRPPAAEVRRRAERRRRNERAGGVAVAAAAVLATVATAAYVRDDPPARVAVAPTQSVAASPATSPAVTATPWLPAPWVLGSERSSTWPAGQPSPYRFCGEPYRPAWPVGVREQALVHPDGRRAVLLELSPAPEDPIQLFKFSYASCLVEGRAESVGGPRNVWSYGSLAGASEPAGATLRLVEVVGPSERDAATRRDAEAALDAWAGR